VSTRSTALLTDHYELTMLSAALRDGTAQRRCVFEVFARSLSGRRYGVVAGTGRLLDLLEDFSFTSAELEHLQGAGVVDSRTADWLSSYRFSGDVDGYPEGEVYFPGSPVLTVEASFASAVVLETLVLSVLNHDSAVATAAARMVGAACGRPVIEMGARRTHEQGAVAAARAAYVSGFAATSNLEAGRRFGIPTTGTSAHAFVLLHDREADAFRAQVDALGVGTTLLVDTYDSLQGIRTAVEVAGPRLGAVRLDSGDLAPLAAQARALLDELGATKTRVIVTSDLDEHAIAALAAAPVDGYGVGTSVVTGAGVPTAGMVYKLVEVDGRPVQKRSVGKASVGGRKSAVRRHREGVAVEELVLARGAVASDGYDDRVLPVALLRKVKRCEGVADLAASREHHRTAVAALPHEAFGLTRGEPALPTTHVEAL